MATIIAKGDASIVINPEETEARLIFTPDPEGLGWDIDAVVKLIGEHHLAPAPSPKTLEPFLQKAARAKSRDPLDTVLLEGTPPENPLGEVIVWEPLSVPGDLIPFQEETLAKAGKPELFRIRTERIKHESTVKKPNPLPFLPPKEEKVVTWEKKESREAVAAVSAAREVRYAEKGKKLGLINPPKPGKPGKSVFNKPIPPAILTDTAFLLGAGLARDKNEVRALRSGFLRIGENWADIVPLAKHAWTVNKGSDGITLFFNFEAGDPRFPLPTGAEVLAAAAAEGAAESSLVSSESVDAAIQEAVNTGEPVAAFSLMRVQNAEARVDINPDKTAAALTLRKGVAGGRPLDMKIISQALRDSGVRGFDAEKLKADIKAFMEGSESELTDYPLVQGKAAARGLDREVNILAKLLEEPEAAAVFERLKAVSPDKLAADGAVVFPMADAVSLALVKKGDKVARVTASAGGEPGKDVFGNVLPGLPGNDPELKLLRGLSLHGSDITASMDGLLLIKAGEKSFRGQVLDYRDAKIAVHVSGDGMEAAVDLEPEQGAGLSLTARTVMDALAEAGVVKGIDTAAVEAACRLAHSRGSCAGQIAARGEPPQAKDSPQVIWLVPLSPPPPGGPSRSIPVEAGSPIADIYPGSPEGRAGFDVMGAVMDSEAGIVVQADHDDSIGESPRGRGVRLTAARAGNLIYDGKNLRISSLQGIKGDVGKATGNLRFSGELRISGKVEPGYSVIGGRNVIIGGAVEGALVSAGGKVVIAGGIRGGGRGVVRARNTIETAFVEEATLLAVEDIRVKAGCVRCNIKTNGKLLIAGVGGKLIGGVSKARQGMNVCDLGSAKGGRTELSFGQDYLVKDQIEVTAGEIEKAQAALKRIDGNMHKAAGNPAALNAARGEKVRLIKLLERLNLKIFTLREKFEEHHESDIRIRGTVYPGVVMESHGRYYEVQQARSRAVFYFDRETGRIQVRALEG